MLHTSGPMSVGDVLNIAIKIVVKRLGLFLVFGLIMFAPSAISQLLNIGMMRGVGYSETGSAPSDAVVAGFMISTLLFGFAGIVTALFGTSAIIKAVSDEYLEEPVSFGVSATHSLRRFFPLLGTWILAGIIAFGALLAGLIALIVGVFVVIVFLMVWYALISHVTVLENTWGISAIVRSKKLTEGFFLRFLGFALLLFVANIIISIPNMVLTPLMDVGGLLALTVFQMIVNIASSVFGLTAWTVMYYDMRNRKEGFDLQYMAWKSARDGGVPQSPIQGAPEGGHFGVSPGAAPDPAGGTPFGGQPGTSPPPAGGTPFGGDTTSSTGGTGQGPERMPYPGEEQPPRT